MSILVSSEDIRVSLSTSKFSPYSDNEFHQKFVDWNLPICVAENYLGIMSNQLEHLEHLVAQSSKEMVKEVWIDIANKYVFIGENHSQETSGLIIYSVQKTNQFEEEFFKQWSNLHQLLFEFQVFDYEKKDIFTLKGLWNVNHWHFLDYIPTSKIKIDDSFKRGNCESINH